MALSSPFQQGQFQPNPSPQWGGGGMSSVPPWGHPLSLQSTQLQNQALQQQMQQQGQLHDVNLQAAKASAQAAQSQAGLHALAVRDAQTASDVAARNRQAESWTHGELNKIKNEMSLGLQEAAELKARGDEQAFAAKQTALAGLKDRHAKLMAVQLEHAKNKVGGEEHLRGVYTQAERAFKVRGDSYRKISDGIGKHLDSYLTSAEMIGSETSMSDPFGGQHGLTTVAGPLAHLTKLPGWLTNNEETLRGHSMGGLAAYEMPIHGTERTAFASDVAVQDTSEIINWSPEFRAVTRDQFLNESRHVDSLAQDFRKFLLDSTLGGGASLPEGTLSTLSYALASAVQVQKGSGAASSNTQSAMGVVDRLLTQIGEQNPTVLSALFDAADNIVSGGAMEEAISALRTSGLDPAADRRLGAVRTGTANLLSVMKDMGSILHSRLMTNGKVSQMGDVESLMAGIQSVLTGGAPVSGLRGYLDPMSDDLGDFGGLVRGLGARNEGSKLFEFAHPELAGWMGGEKRAQTFGVEQADIDHQKALVDLAYNEALEGSEYALNTAFRDSMMGAQSNFQAFLKFAQENNIPVDDTLISMWLENPQQVMQPVFTRMSLKGQQGGGV